MKTRQINGATVRALREALGISLTDLAERAGVNKGYLSKVETAGRQPSGKVTVGIALGLGVSLEAITYPVYSKPLAA